MREIKFRAWDNNVKEMIIQDNTDRIDKIPHYWETHIKTTIMQYIGLKDKNGIEIYEEDIVRFQHIDDYGYMTNVFQNESHVGVVKWGGFYPAFDIFNINDNSTFGFDCNIFSMESDVVIEIIGNIYENPELLKD